MKTILIFFALLAHAIACESIYIPPCAMGNENQRIFVGTASEKLSSGEFRFSVEEPTKGITPDTKQVDVGPGPCMMGYEIGARYLMLLKTIQGPEGTFNLSNGERIESATDSIEFFHELARGGKLTILKGRTAENVSDSMVTFELDAEHHAGLPGVVVTASKDGREYSTATDLHGAWSLRVPEPGTYNITAILAGHASTDPAYDLEVAPDSCQELDFGMWTASKISGRLTDANGQPAARIPVQLVDTAEEHSFPPTAKTDANGKFEFTNIPPGEYFVGVNATGLNSQLPYETRLYPGVSDRTAAKTIAIEGAQTIEGLDFQLGEPLPTRRIEIAVFWQDGKPVINADVTCISASRDLVMRYVDQQGKATCVVLANEDFTVEANGLSWKASGRPIQPIATRPKFSVPAGTETVHLTFIVDAINDISAKEAPENMAAFNDREE